MPTLKRYLPDGSTRQIIDAATVYRTKGKPCFRASRVEVIPEGEQANRFHVDFTPLHEETQRPEHQLCLVATFDSYYDAVNAEIDWLTRNYVLEPTTCSAY